MNKNKFINAKVGFNENFRGVPISSLLSINNEIVVIFISLETSYIL